jgi:hypothetical protein
MKFKLPIDEIDQCAKVVTPTKVEVDRYRVELDRERRIQMAWKYQITSDDLYPEDLDEILKNVEEAMKNDETD